MPSTSTLGVLFVVVGLAAMFLMYHLWGYPFDKATRTSSAPRWAMYLHRGLGYLFAIVYVLLMIRMLPRLWQYQVEFPARTALHIVLGFTIGFLLIVKISIIRFFRHFEEWMPYLGTAIMLLTVVLLGLSLPFAFREQALAASAPGGSAFSKASQERVARLLPDAKLPAEADLTELASAKGLRAGRSVLVDKCTVCHDMKTILSQPRTPSGWASVVDRMGSKPTLFTTLSDEDMWRATAYLIAITPDLQKSRKMRREQQMARMDAMADASKEMMAAMTPPADGEAPAPARPPVDHDKARSAFEDGCSQCHDLSDVDGAPPEDAMDALDLIRRMIEENDAEFTKEEIEAIHFYLVAHYVEKTL